LNTRPGTAQKSISAAVALNARLQGSQGKLFFARSFAARTSEENQWGDKNVFFEFFNSLILEWVEQMQL
jgi:hypothetical protein